MQNILKEIIFWALLASCDFHNNEVQCPRKALLADAWSEILVGLSQLGLTVLSRLCVFRKGEKKGWRPRLLFPRKACAAKDCRPLSHLYRKMERLSAHFPLW